MSSNNNGGRAKATLFVRGLPHDATNDQLEAFFSEIGPVRSCFVVMENLPEDKKDIQRHNKGYGFVQYAIPEDATRAIEELKNKKFREERILRMELALKKHTSSSDKKLAISKDQTAKNKNIKNKIKEYSSTVKPRLIIRNLSFFCKKHHLQKIFEKFGTLDYIDVPTKPGREDLARGYGFVGFINEKDAEKAMNEMNGKKILGRVVAIDWSVPRALYKQIEEENKENEEDEDKMDVDEDENESENEESDDESNEDENNEEKEEESEEESEEDDEESQEEEENDDGIKVIMDDDESEEEDDEDDDEDDDKSDDDNKYPEVEEKKTLFIRNLSFDTEQDSLYEKFKKFGPLNYARITKDYETGKSRGTGFVCFHKREDAEKCLKAYEEAEKHAYEFEEQQQPKGKKKESTIHSVLRPEPMLNDATSPFILDGRFLKVNIAVRRGEAEQLINATNIRKRKEDTRNMYLIREGVIFPDSDLGKQINQSELSKRITSYTSRKQMLAKNPNLFISKTRLSIRNLIPSIDDKILKQKARESVIGFWKDVQNNKRKNLEDYVIEEEKSSGKGTPGLKRKVVIKQAKILRSKDRIDNETKLGRSKGCGFVEFGSHADALACLRYMNNNNKIFEGMSKRTPIVEFAVENRIILKRREDRMNRKNKREQLAKANNVDESTVNLLNNKRKRGEEKKNTKKNKKGNDNNESIENPPAKKQKVEGEESKQDKKKKKNKKNKKSKKEENKIETSNKTEEKIEKSEKSEKSEGTSEKKDKKKNKKANKKSKREQKEAKEDKQFNDLIKLHGKSNLIKGNSESSSLLKGTDFSAMKKWFE